MRRGDGAGGRGVFGAGESGADGTRCPRCAHLLALAHDHVERAAWGAAITDRWGGGEGALAGPGCHVATPVVDWPADRPMAFGYLALELWELPFSRTRSSRR